MDKSPSQTTFEDLLKANVAPILKAAGYKKSGSNFFCRSDQVSFLINFQSSSGSTWEEKIFYINIGLAFDEICLHREIDILDRPKEHYCSSRGASVRVGEIFSDAPARYSISENDDLGQLKIDLENLFNDLITNLSTIKNLSSFRKHRWFEDLSGVPGMKALIYFLLGEQKNAETEINVLVNKFTDRKMLCEKSYWTDRFNIKMESFS